MEWNIEKVLKNSNISHELKVFDKDRVKSLKIFDKNGKPYLKCLIREKDVLAKPEEIIQQLFLDKLLNEYDYPKEYINVLHKVPFGREIKQADIVIFHKNDKSSIYCVIEVKQHKEKEGRDQLRSYTNATGAPLAVWTNGSEIEYFLRIKPNLLKSIRNIPKFDEKISDIENQPFTYLDLMKKDKLMMERKSLRDIIKEMEDEVLANAGVDIFEEVFKLIFIKLYDEKMSSGEREEIERQLKKFKKENPNKSDEELYELIDDEGFKNLEFRSRGDSYDTKDSIMNLFGKAKDEWSGIFERNEPIRISDENHLDICVSFLEEIKLFNSNLSVIDDAFEYLVNKSAKGEKGQYFTPRNVIDMCVKMLNPKDYEYMIDPACGSCGFTVHTIFDVWDKLKREGKANGDKFSNLDKTPEQKDYVKKVFGIDFDEKSVRVARMLNLIAGDGKTNVLHMNALDYPRWEEKIKDKEWRKSYLEGYDRLLEKARDNNSAKDFNFDIVMANPPFAGDIKDSRLIHQYSLSEKDKGYVAKISRDILFIERNLDFLKPGGRMAIVLPQGRFNNTQDQRIRDFILERCRLIAVVGLDVNTFKPHTGTKTSVLFVQKWNDDKTKGPLCLKDEDYPIFFAVSENSGKDNSGQPIYKKKENGAFDLDKYNHLIQIHDLYKYDKDSPEGIAEKFKSWAEEQELSFWTDKEENKEYIRGD